MSPSPDPAAASRRNQPLCRDVFLAKRHKTGILQQMRPEKEELSRAKEAGRVPECLIIAAGKGSRLIARGEPKPLVTIGGVALIEWVMCTAALAGIRSFCIVTGYLAGDIERFVPASPLLSGLDVRFVHNADWELANGVSVARAAASLGSRFILLMSDHLFDARILSRLMAEPIGDDEVILAVDMRIQNHPTADIDDVTKVLVVEGAILDIGKGLVDYNAFDTGIFLCTPALFFALDESFRNGEHSLSSGIRRLASRGRARAFDIGDALWIDVDDDEACKLAGNMFAPQPAATVLPACGPAPARAAISRS